MKLDIIDKPGFLIVGVRALWNLDPDILGSLWTTKVLPRRKEIKAAPGTESSAFGVFAAIPDDREGMFEYVAGMMVASLEDIPNGMVGWDIPEGTYVSAPATGLENIFPVYKELIEQWLPTSGYELAPSPVFTISPNAADPANPTALWQVNVQIRKSGISSEIDAWGVE